MNVGAILGPGVRTPEHIELAERLGYERAWVFDSPALFADPWMTLARAADRTERIRLGVSVITPRMRHLVANAGAAATLAALAPDRVDVVIGAGFTSQAMIQKKPARWAEVEEYTRGLRALLAGEVIEWDGGVAALRPGRLTGVELPASVPIWVAAHGPKGYEVAGRVADGIVTNPGHGADNANWAAGEGTVYAQFNATILDPGEGLDAERVIDAGGPPAALHLHLGEQGAAAGTAEAAEYARRLGEVEERVRHIEMHRGHLAEVTDLERDLLTPELLARTTATGEPAQVRAALDAVAAEGFAGILYAAMGPDIPRELTSMAELLELPASG
jgi:5,10-methylenetetrahydromethanopterin reductase